MITLEELLCHLTHYDKQDQNLLQDSREMLFLKNIRPDDLPKKDWPEPPPNKRVIIIDI